MGSVIEAKKKKKSTWIAYLCWFIGGFFGLHLFYLRRDRHAFLHWFTFGGGFGCGYMRDLLLMRTYVANVNSDPNYVQKVVEKMKKHKKPPFSITGFSKQISAGYLMGMLFWFAIPNDGIGEDEYDLTWLRCLSPIPIALGIHTYGNIDHEQGSLRAPIVSAFIALALAYVLVEDIDAGPMLGFTALVATAVFVFKCKQWRPIVTENDEQDEMGFFRRVFNLSVCGLIVIALLTSGIYFNFQITDSYGEKIKFRDAAGKLFNSQLYEQLLSAYRDFSNFYKAHGWGKVFDQVYDQLDYTHEDKARKVLGVTSNASKEMIVSRWRTLSKEWHPDRHRDPAKKAEAQLKFMEFQAAYQTLVKIRGKFKAAKESGKSDL